MAKQYANCQYHGKYEVREADDFQCPKCAKEVFDYGGWRSGRIPLTEDAKNLMKRAGVKF